MTKLDLGEEIVLLVCSSSPWDDKSWTKGSVVATGNTMRDEVYM